MGDRARRLMLWFGFCAILISFSITAKPIWAACTQISCKILVVGDFGIGDDAYYQGFLAVQQAMVAEGPDLVLYAGDYIYAKTTCEEPTPTGSLPVDEVQDKLVTPFQGNVVFSRGDNDAPTVGDDASEVNKIWAAAQHRCWREIAKKGLPLHAAEGAGEDEGVIDNFPGVFIAVLNEGALAASNLEHLNWLRKPVRKAKDDGKWVVVLVHEPVVTTAWYAQQCCTTLELLQQIGVDLVFSGHQHAYERTHQLQVTASDVTPINVPNQEVYRAGSGVVYTIAGGAGAWLRSFADQQQLPDRLKPFVAPPNIMSASARRAIMNHYVRVDFAPKRARVTTMRVCTDGESRWHPDRAETWPQGPSMLACHGIDPSVTTFDRFEVWR